MNSEPYYYPRLNGKIGRVRPLSDLIRDAAGTPGDLRRMEVRRTGTEEWLPLSSVVDLKNLPADEGPAERGNHGRG